MSSGGSYLAEQAAAWLLSSSPCLSQWEITRQQESKVHVDSFSSTYESDSFLLWSCVFSWDMIPSEVTLNPLCKVSAIGSRRARAYVGCQCFTLIGLFAEDLTYGSCEFSIKPSVFLLLFLCEFFLKFSFTKTSHLTDIYKNRYKTKFICYCVWNTDLELEKVTKSRGSWHSSGDGDT